MESNAFKRAINTSLLMLSFALFMTLFTPNTLPAQQVQFQYSVVGGQSWTWIFDQHPTVYEVAADAFSVLSVPGDPGGGSPGMKDVFYLSSAGGGLEIGNGIADVVNFFPTGGEQFFSGTTAIPIFNVFGTFSGHDNVAGADASLTITAVPEPATYLTLAGGLALGAIMVAKKKKKGCEIAK